MKRALIAAVALLFVNGCQGDAGPIGPSGIPGENGEGYEFVQIDGTVPPTTGTITVQIPFLRMSCPPIVQVYLETAPMNWVPAPIFDTYTQDGQDAYHMEFFVLHNNSIDITSISAIAFQRPIEYRIIIFAPQGYFESGYRCP